MICTSACSSCRVARLCQNGVQVKESKEEKKAREKARKKEKDAAKKSAPASAGTNEPRVSIVPTPHLVHTYL